MSSENLPSQIDPTLLALAKTMQVVAADAPQNSGEAYLKMTKQGEWVYGVEEFEIEEGSLWAANPSSFLHGWIGWGDKDHKTNGQRLGEQMTPINQPLIDPSTLPEIAGKWTKQVQVSLRCMDGEDEGSQMIYNTNSHGGKKAIGELQTKIVEQIMAGKNTVVPLLTLENDSYKHKEYGKIYNPVFEIQDWITIDGSPADDDPEMLEDQSEEAEEEIPQTTKRRSRKKTA